MSGPEVLLRVVEWAGVIALVVYILLSAYREIVDTLYERGFPVPDPLAKAVVERKKLEIDHVLTSLGLTTRATQYAQLGEILNIPENRQSDAYKTELKRIIAAHFSRRHVKVGKTYSFVFDYYIDIMEACANHLVAERCARIMANFIRDEITQRLGADNARPIIFNKIVVPKGGTPTLGFMLGYVLRKPCAFFRGQDEAKTRDPAPPEAFFDGEIAADDLVILVDDSSTGGRMFEEAIHKLKDMNIKVEHAFVLFEPLGKDARGRLKALGVELHSIFPVTEDFIEEITKMAQEVVANQ